MTKKVWAYVRDRLPERIVLALLLGAIGAGCARELDRMIDAQCGGAECPRKASR